jgi:hypothetical protein
LTPAIDTKAKMTAQFSERLIFEGQQVALLSNPLNDYFALSGSDPGFESTSTALWRGYVGTWEILNDRLYLVELRGTLKSGDEASVASVFPEFSDRVFAHWFSGRLRIPQGKRLEYVHMGYASTYERDVLLNLQNGVVVAKEIRVNGQAEGDALEGYSIGAMTTWPARKSGGEE